MIVVDVETSGLDPTRHSIVSIGAVEFANPENKFYEVCRIWEGAEISQKALERNGFSEEEIRDPNKKSLEEALKEFFEWAAKVDEQTLAGHNPSFDRDFLRTSAERYGLPWAFSYRTVDLHSLCYTHFLRRNLAPPVDERV